MKQPFDLSFYKSHPDCKVETRDGKPARIVCTDAYSKDNYPIVALVNDGEREFANSYNPAGRCCIHNYDDDLDLFIVTDEEELTEFEQAVRTCVVTNLTTRTKGSMGEIVSTVFIDDDTTRKIAKELLSLAREQLIHEGYIIEKKAFHDAVEKVEPEVMKEVEENVTIEMIKKNLIEFYENRLAMNEYNATIGEVQAQLNDYATRIKNLVQRHYNTGKAEDIKAMLLHEYNAGRASVLKDLPRWKKTDYRPGQKLNHLYYDEKRDMILLDGYYLTTNDVKKLPGFKEE